MTDILNNNLRCLQKYQPNVYNKLNSYIQGKYQPLDNTVDRVLLANYDDIIINMLVVCKNGQFAICDNEDPIGQSYEWIDRFIDPANSSEIVFGMGFAYHLEVLITSFRNKKIILIEPNIELFHQILKVRNMELVIKNSEILLDLQIDGILGRINTLFWSTDSGGIQCEPLEVYAEIFYELWDDLRSKFIKHAQNFNVDIATRRFFGDLWISNYIKNAEKMFEASNAFGLTGKFKGMPGILVSAGPSLSKNIHILNELKDKAVIMAAGTAAKILDEKDITPHFMVGIDASEIESEIHRNLSRQDINFIYSNQVATGSIESYKGPKFLMNYSIDSYTNDLINYAGIESGIFLSGPSVSNTCFDILRKMGCNPIILIGQDLGFTGGSNYAFEEGASDLKSKGNFEKEDYILLKDIYGNDIYTTLPFLSIKNWFEAYFERVDKEVEILNATEGGLNIEFAKNIELKELIEDRNFKSFDINGMIAEIYQENHFTDGISKTLIGYKEKILNEITRLDNEADELNKIADYLKRDLYHPNKDKKGFDRMIRRINVIFDNVLKSPVYETILKNLIEIEFYIIKNEVERGSRQTENYSEIKDLYLDAIKRQHSILKGKLGMVKRLLSE